MFTTRTKLGQGSCVTQPVDSDFIWKESPNAFGNGYEFGNGRLWRREQSG